MALAALLWVAAASALSFVQFGVDKRRARSGRWRLSERALLVTAAAGGTVGAYAGRWWFRHKIRKQPFSTLLHVIAAVQAGLAIGWGVAR